MPRLGMDVDAVESIGHQMIDKSHAVTSVQLTAARLIQDAHSLWFGANGARWLSDWVANEKAVRTLASDLESMGQTLLSQASEQRGASSADGGGSDHSTEGNGTTLYLDQIPDGALSGDGPDAAEDDRGNKVNEKHNRPAFVPIPLTDADLSMDAVGQGYIGDCWFMSALGSVADDDPQFIRDHIRHNPDLTWTVILYDHGEPVEVTLSPFFGEDSARDSSGRVSFVTLYEKALAQHRGFDYDLIEGDRVSSGDSSGFEYITGGHSKSVEPTTLEDLRTLIDKGPVNVGTINDHTTAGMHPNHAYMVDRVEERLNPSTGKTELMVRVVNPWQAGDEAASGEPGSLWLTESEFRRNCESVTSIDRRTYQR